MILDIAPTELLVLGTVALLVIPPKDLPRAMRFAGQWVGRARGLARQFRSGFDDMIREAEFAEMEKKWKAENERIMREFPQVPDMAKLMAPDSAVTASAVTTEHDGDAAPSLVEPPVIAPDRAGAAAPAGAEPTVKARPRARKKPVPGNEPAARTPARSRRKPAADASPPGTAE